MTRAAKQAAGATPEWSHLDYWLYGITKTASELGNARLFLRAAQEESIRKALEHEPLEVRDPKDPVQVLAAYNERLEKMEVLDASEISYRSGPHGVDVRVGAGCPYRCTCDSLEREGMAPPCFRASAMGSVLRRITHKSYEGTLRHFGIPCHLSFKELRLEAGEDGD